MSIMSALGGSARMPALLDITCGSRIGEDHDLARFQRHGLAADQAGKAAARVTT